MSDANTVKLDAPIDKVTLLEDRAHVFRAGHIELAVGRHILVISNVAPVMVDKTLSVSSDDSQDSFTMGGARVRRQAVFRDVDTDDTELGTKERELHELNDTLRDQHRDSEAASQEIAALTAITTLTMADLATDAAWGKSVVSAVELETVRSKTRDLIASVVDAEFEQEKLEQQQARLIDRIETLRNPGKRHQAQIEITVDIATPCRLALRIDYMVPGACWRPQHRAELVETDGESSLVRFSTDGCVWQNTGEDWDGVALLFSTERASLGTTPPLLSKDALRWRKRSDEIVVAAREQAIDTVGPGMGYGAGGGAAAELPGIDDGGDILELRAQQRCDIPSNGRPHRVPIAEFESDADIELVCFPELSACVLTRVTVINRGTRPILAGPVVLLRNSGPVGRTKMLFVAPNERFELGWGPDAELRVHRSFEARDEKSRVLSSWHRSRKEVAVRLSNLGSEKRSVQVVERVPVSELEKVKIEPDSDKTTGNQTPDDQGFVTWNITLDKHAHQELELVYTVERHRDVHGL